MAAANIRPVKPTSAEAQARSLLRIKLVHTGFWALFAGAILAVPFVLLAGRLDWALWLTGLVLVEIAVLAVNGMACPLTAVAARFTDERRANFDIFLPEWLAAHNKAVFGWLFVFDLGLLAWRWLAG